MLVNPNLKNQRNEAQMRRLWLLALMPIPQVVSKQLSAHFLLTFNASSLAPCTDEDTPSGIEKAVCACFAHICA